jgi:hypothetical protein
VRTEDGIEFRTLAEVQLPAAQIGIVNNEFVVIPSTKTVAIESIIPGVLGNVPANSIVIVPEGENPPDLGGNQPRFRRTTSGPQVYYSTLTTHRLDEPVRPSTSDRGSTPEGTTFLPRRSRSARRRRLEPTTLPDGGRRVRARHGDGPSRRCIRPGLTR